MARSLSLPRLSLRFLPRIKPRGRRASHPVFEQKVEHVDEQPYLDSPVQGTYKLQIQDSLVGSVTGHTQIEALDSVNQDHLEDPQNDQTATLNKGSPAFRLSSLSEKDHEDEQRIVTISISRPQEPLSNDTDAQRAPANVDYESLQLNGQQRSAKSVYNAGLSSRELYFSKMERQDTSGIIEEDYHESDDDNDAIDELSTIESEISNGQAGALDSPDSALQVQQRGPQPYETERVLKLHMGILGLRSYIMEKRRVLREKQLARSIADDRLIQYIRQRELGAQQTSKSEITKSDIDQLLKDCEQIRNEYGPLEDELNSLEDDLGRQEFQFLELLKRSPMWKQYTSDSFERDGAPRTAMYAASESSDNSYMEDLVRKPHPLVSKYHSKLGDLDILYERLEENREERDGLEKERETKKRVGLALNPEDQDFLDGFPALETLLLEKITKAKERVDQVREKCLTHGLIDEYGEETDFATQELKSFDEESTLSPVTEQSEFVKFPILLPDPNRQVHLGDTTLEAKEKAESSERLVDSWLLHQLRSSPLAVNLLATTYKSEGRKIKENWETDVLDFWFLDEPPKPPPRSPEPSWGSGTSLQRSL
ncbi:hypothetical protein F5884DRAFT_450410 [Xylogone sp. PMI_703]|nr:hypothetical protein F5884DRAFT_450410 [Xylogone sp. PMI_703]